MEGVAIQLDDGRIGYICGETLLQATSEEQDTLRHNSKFACTFPNCDKTYSSVNHLRVRNNIKNCFVIYLNFQDVIYNITSESKNIM